MLCFHVKIQGVARREDLYRESEEETLLNFCTSSTDAEDL